MVLRSLETTCSGTRHQQPHFCWLRDTVLRGSGEVSLTMTPDPDLARLLSAPEAPYLLPMTHDPTGSQGKARTVFWRPGKHG